MEGLIVREMTILVTNNGWKIYNSSSPKVKQDTLPSLMIKVDPTSAGRDICGIKFSHRNENGVDSQTIELDLVEGIVSMVEPDTHQHKNWVYTDRITNLSFLFERIICLMDADTLSSIIALYPSIFGWDENSDQQKAFDIFVSQVSVYLTFVTLIHQHSLTFPISFNFPLDKFDNRILSQECFKYFYQIFKIVSSLEYGLCQELTWFLCNFINSWSDCYQSIHLEEITSPVISALPEVFDLLARRLEEKIQSYDREIKEYLDIQIQGLNSRLLNLESIKSNSHSSEDRSSETVFSVSHKHVSSLSVENSPSDQENSLDLSGPVPEIFREDLSEDSLNLTPVPDFSLSSSPGNGNFQRSRYSVKISSHHDNYFGRGLGRYEPLPH